MARSDTPEQQQKSAVDHVAEEVFTSEKREDLWAILIVVFVFLLCVMFPGQAHNFFTKTLYLF